MCDRWEMACVPTVLPNDRNPCSTCVIYERTDNLSSLQRISNNFDLRSVNSAVSRDHRIACVVVFQFAKVGETKSGIFEILD